MDKELAQQMIEFLTQASDLAYVEGAQGSARLLGCMQRLLRYKLQQSQWVPLKDEVAAVTDFITIRRALFGERLQFLTFPEADIFVPFLCLVNALENICTTEAFLSNPWTEYQITVERWQNMAKGYELRLILRKRSEAGVSEEIWEWPI